MEGGFLASVWLVVSSALIMAFYYIFVVLFMGGVGFLVFTIIDVTAGTKFVPAFKAWISGLQESVNATDKSTPPGPPPEWSGSD